MEYHKEIWDINTKYNLEFIFPCKEDKLFSLYFIFIGLQEDKCTHILYMHDCIGALQDLHELISKALKKNLFLHSSITKDIGYLWNEELQNKPGLTYNVFEGIEFWVGLSNLLWSTPRGPTTWLYNKNNKIILEVTPSYPWHHVYPEPEEQYISYEEFMHNYQPLAKIEIPRDIAQKWLNRAKNLLQIIEQNEA